MTRKIQKYTVLITLLLVYGCQQRTSVPFPENASGTKIPLTESFDFPESRSIEWLEVSSDSVPVKKVYPLDLNQLPSAPFTVNSFKPLKEPITTFPLNWNQLENHDLNLDTVQTQSLLKTTFVLEDPEVSKALPPSQFPRSNSGILQLGLEEGLPGNYVVEIITDKSGTIWISSEKGLTRYKGEFFETFDFLPKLSNSNSDFIIDMVVDNENQLWLITNSGKLYMIETDKGIAHRFNHKDVFSRMTFDQHGNLWLTAWEKGISILNFKNDTFKRLRLFESIENAMYIGILKDSKNNIWIGNQSGVYVINREQTAYKMLTGDDHVDVSFGFGFFETRNGDIWISSFAEGATSIAGDKKSIRVLGEKQGFSGSLLAGTEDSEGKIWCFDNDTIFVYVPNKAVLKKIPTGVRIYADRVFGNVLIDWEQNLWVTTPLNRTMIIDPIGTLPEHLDVSDGLTSNDIWGITEDKEGLVWIGTYNGINLFDPVKNKLMLINTDNGLSHNRRTHFNLLNNGTMLVAGANGFCIIDKKKKTLTEYSCKFFIWSSYEHSDGTFWFGARDGIYYFDPETKECKKITENNGVAANTIWTMHSDNQGILWGASITDIFLINPKRMHISNFPNELLKCDNYYAIYPSKAGELWIAGDLGLSVINSQHQTITTISSENGLIPESSYTIAELNDKIYLGSGDGILLVNPPESTTSEELWHFYNYNKRNGFPFNDYNQTSSAIISNNQIWCGVVPQITVLTQEPVFDLSKPRVFISGINIMDQLPRYIGPSDQKQAFEFTDTIWNEDLTEFYIKNTFPEDSGYYQQNNITWDSLSPVFHLPLGLQLPYHQNSVSFSFTNPDIKGKDKIVYRYILEGSDKNWSRITDKPNSKDYYNLKKGNYVFKVATRGFNGVWSETATYEFTVLAPWYTTWFALLTYLALALLLLRAYVVFRARKFKKENKILEAKVAQRTQQLSKSIKDLKATQGQLIHAEKMASLGELTAGIAHEIQNPLNFVNNFSELGSELLEEMQDELDKNNIDEVKTLAKDINLNLQKILHHGQRADAIVKNMLLHSRGNSGQKQVTDINALADEYLRLSFHGLRAKDKSFNADFKLEADKNLPKVKVVPQDLGRVLLNLINNAFYAVFEKSKENKDGYKPMVIVKTQESNNQIVITVRDNGPGIPETVRDKIFQPFFTTKAAGDGTGLGLSLSYDIVKNHNGELKVHTEQDTGTEFIIVLPLNAKL